MDKKHLIYGGHCDFCQENHRLESTPTSTEATKLIAELATKKTIQANQPGCSTDILFGKARGQMFGVMLAQDSTGNTHVLKAFSGQFNSQYNIVGWVPPIFDLHTFSRLNTLGEKEIKDLTHKLATTLDPAQQQELKQKRRNLSRVLMKQIHDLYILHNFRGQQRPMTDFFPKNRGMPTGAGDCCAPKLIQYAVNHNLTPLGMSEFYFGLENKSGTRQHGQFYSSCKANCAPILGFMLCGLENKRRYRM